MGNNNSAEFSIDEDKDDAGEGGQDGDQILKESVKQEKKQQRKTKGSLDFDQLSGEDQEDEWENWDGDEDEDEDEYIEEEESSEIEMASIEERKTTLPLTQLNNFLKLYQENGGVAIINAQINDQNLACFTKRMSRKYKREIRNIYQHYLDNQERVTQINKSYHFNYRSKFNQLSIPNASRHIDDTNSAIYNVNYDLTGHQLLVTSQDGLSLYREDFKTNEFENVLNQNPGCISWAISDSDLSMDGQYFIHSTLNPYISLYDTTKEKYMETIDVTEVNHMLTDIDEELPWWNRLRIFSVQLDADAKIALVSSSQTKDGGLIKIIDLDTKQVQLNINAHNDDINSITFIDQHDPHLFMSGSDDCLVKVWDSRDRGIIGNQPAGFFLGHVCGVTHVSSREDGLYMASNGKDQTLQVWDLRQLCSEPENKPSCRGKFRFDYRQGYFPPSYQREMDCLTPDNNFDNSILTFQGHEVLSTLIRCHFSPSFNTDSRYVYSGSRCGRIYIYDLLTGETAAILQDKNFQCVRDCIWSPNDNQIVSGNFNGEITEWQFKQDLKPYQTKKE